MCTSGEYIFNKYIYIGASIILFSTGALIFDHSILMSMSYEHLSLLVFQCWLQLLQSLMRYAVTSSSSWTWMGARSSPNKPNIFYSVCKRSTIEDDFSSILD